MNIDGDSSDEDKHSYVLFPHGPWIVVGLKSKLLILFDEFVVDRIKR
jgi:hypothetical protein